MSYLVKIKKKKKGGEDTSLQTSSQEGCQHFF